jgi:FMN phosphatase YigB (HAD superfamily)
MITGIFFDAGGIFYTREEPTRHYALRLVTEQGISTEMSPEEDARLRTLKEQASNGWIDAPTYWDEFLMAHAVADQAKRSELTDKILKHVNMVSAVPGAREVMRDLKQRGFILGVITSTMYSSEWKISWLEEVGVAEFIDILICSTELGQDKTHPTIFWAALTKAKLNPWQTAYVANGARELAEAHHLGMSTVAVLYEPDAKADYYVQTLPDLLSVPIFQR